MSTTCFISKKPDIPIPKKRINIRIVILLDEFYNLIFARMLGLPRASTIYKSLGIRYVSFK